MTRSRYLRGEGSAGRWLGRREGNVLGDDIEDRRRHPRQQWRRRVYALRRMLEGKEAVVSR